MTYVVDSSALVKLIVSEEHSKTLGSWVANCNQDLFISELARTEVSRAISRVDSNLNKQFNTIINRFGIIRVSTQVLTIAETLSPTSLRTLDAIHLASCIILGDTLTGFVTYDNAQAIAALINRIDVFTP
jgi:predicted nucleic acid-binding protein